MANDDDGADWGMSPSDLCYSLRRVWLQTAVTSRLPLSPQCVMLPDA